jgi:hypothetical protein
LARGVRTLWLASYNMDVADAASRNRFLQKVERGMQTLGGPGLR